MLVDKPKQTRANIFPLEELDRILTRNHCNIYGGIIHTLYDRHGRYIVQLWLLLLLNCFPLIIIITPHILHSTQQQQQHTFISLPHIIYIYSFGVYTLQSLCVQFGSVSRILCVSFRFAKRTESKLMCATETTSYAYEYGVVAGGCVWYADSNTFSIYSFWHRIGYNAKRTEYGNLFYINLP